MIENHRLLVHGVEVPIHCGPNIMRPDYKALVNSGLLEAWAEKLDPRFFVTEVFIQSVDLFGSRVGFLKFEAKLTGRNPDGTSDGKFIPGITFMRGDSVAILVVLEVESETNEAEIEEYTVLTVQPRSATGSFAFVEVPAGMLDGSGDFIGTAAKELAEELGKDFAVKRKDLVDLLATTGTLDPPFVSPGGSDERMRFYLLVRRVTRAMLKEINGRATGVLHEGERITLKTARLEDVSLLPDLKSREAHRLYKLWKHLMSVEVTVPAAVATTSAT